MMAGSATTLIGSGVSLWVGNESHDWQLADFTKAAQWALAHGVDTLFVKVFSGANGNVGSPDEWYGSIGGFDAAYKTLIAAGIQTVVPWGYMYGNASGSVLSIELSLVNKYMDTYGAFIADIETQWNGQTSWGAQLNAALINNPNKFYVSLLADPNEQNMVGVIKAMAPSVNGWMPQVYTDWLASVWQSEFSAMGLTAPLMPTYSLGSDMGPNNVVATVSSQMQYADKSVWVYATALTNSLLDQIIALSKGQTNIVIPLSTTGEIAVFCDADQFQPAKTQDACGFFACWIVKAASQVGKPCGLSAAEVIAKAEASYAEYNGDNSISNQWGMSLAQLYKLIPEIGLHFQGIADFTNIELLRAWVRAGYPVIIAIPERFLFDIALGDKVPYYWNYQSFNHIVTLTGVDKNGNFLVRDSANVTDLNNPNSLRPGPRTYDAGRMVPISATAVVPPWMPRPPAGFDPRKDTISMVPSGWTDNGTILTAPNKMTVHGAIRVAVLGSSWDSGDWPITGEYPIDVVEDGTSTPLSAGSVAQDFMYHSLYWSSSTGHVGQRKIGQDYQYQKQQAAALQAKLNAIQPCPDCPPSPVPDPVVSAFVSDVETLLKSPDGVAFLKEIGL